MGKNKSFRSKGASIFESVLNVKEHDIITVARKDF